MPAFSGKKGRLFGAALLLLLAVAGGWWMHAVQQCAAMVGEACIGETDIGYRIGVEQAYGTSLAREAALVVLVNDAIQREVGRPVGVQVTEKDLDGFSAYVDKSSKAPEVLAKVKQVFGADTEAYRSIWLAPKVMNRKLHDWFNRDEQMQQRPRAAIRQAYALAAAGNDFEQVAKATGLKFTEQDYGAETKDAPDALRAYFPEGMAMMTPAFQKLLDGMEPGGMANTIVEDDSSYRVVRLTGNQGGTYKTAEIIAAKEPFDPWFRKRRADVRVDIRDAGLRAAIAANFPKLDWMNPRMD